MSRQQIENVYSATGLGVGGGHEVCEMVYRVHDQHTDDRWLYALDSITLFGSALRHDTKHAQV